MAVFVELSVVLSQRRSATSTVSTKRTANSLWLASERVSALLTTRNISTLSLEVSHSDSGQLRSGVVLGLILMDFVDWDGGVDDGGLDRLFLDDGLDILVHVVVNVLAGDGGALRSGVVRCTFGAGALELGSFSGNALLYVSIVPVLDLAMLYTDQIVAVLFWENFPVLDGLNRGVIVVLVDLPVNGRLRLLMVRPLYGLVGDSWVDGL